MLKDAKIKVRIVKDYLNNFYLPCLERADRYDLMVAYLNPKTFENLYRGLLEFFKKDGCCMRLLISPDISNIDYFLEILEKLRVSTDFALGLAG